MIKKKHCDFTSCKEPVEYMFVGKIPMCKKHYNFHILVKKAIDEAVEEDGGFFHEGDWYKPGKNWGI